MCGFHLALHAAPYMERSIADGKAQQICCLPSDVLGTEHACLWQALVVLLRMQCLSLAWCWHGSVAL